MKVETNRSTFVAFVIVLVVVAFCAGLALALSGVDSQIPSAILGALSMVAGVLLLASRSVFNRVPVRSVEQHIAAEQPGLVRIRAVGAAVFLQGVAQFVPDMRLRTAVMLCAMAVAVAAIFRFPWRRFVVKKSAE